MEQVVVESVFNVSKSIKAQLDLAKGFFNIGDSSKKSQAQSSIFANNLKTQVLTYDKLNAKVDAYTKLLNKQVVGSKEYFATQKRLIELEKQRSL